MVGGRIRIRISDRGERERERERERSRVESEDGGCSFVWAEEVRMDDGE